MFSNTIIMQHLNDTHLHIFLRIRLFYGKIRRQFIIFFMHDYIVRQMRRRAGTCRQCAVCCNFSYRCPFLTRHSFCKIYTKGRPRVCSYFPINQADIDDVKACGGQCGYRFE